MDNVHPFLSKRALASISKSDKLHDAVLDLVTVIDAISSTDAERAERKELARDARRLLREMMRDDGGA